MYNDDIRIMYCTNHSKPYKLTCWLNKHWFNITLHTRHHRLKDQSFTVQPCITESSPLITVRSTLYVIHFSWAVMKACSLLDSLSRYLSWDQPLWCSVDKPCFENTTDGADRFKLVPIQQPFICKFIMPTTPATHLLPVLWHLGFV